MRAGRQVRLSASREIDDPGRLASHVAEMPSWAKTTLETELLEMEPGFKPFIAQSRAELLQTFDKGVEEAREKIKAATEEDWKKIWTFKYQGQTLWVIASFFWDFTQSAPSRTSVPVRRSRS